MDIDAILTANRNLQIRANKSEELAWHLRLEIEKNNDLKNEIIRMQKIKLGIALIYIKDEDGIFRSLHIVKKYETENGVVIEVSR